jgi:MFS family permease
MQASVAAGVAATDKETVAGPMAGIGMWWTAAVLSLLYILSYVDRTIAAHLVDPIKHSFSLSDFEMSLILGPAFGFTYALASIPAGWFADRFDRRIVIMCGVLFWSLMTIACGFATSAVALVAARMMVAIGEATLGPAAASLIADRFPPRHLGAGMAVYQSGAKLGSSLGYFVAAGAIVVATALAAPGALISGHQPWQLVFVLVGLPGLVVAFLPLTFSKVARTTPRKSKASGASKGELINFLREHKRIFLPLILAFLLIAIPGGAMNAWLPTFMSRTFDWTPAIYGPKLGVTTAIAAMAVIPNGLLIDWLYKRGVRDASLRILTYLLMFAVPLAASVFFLGPDYFVIGIGLLQFVVLSYPFFVLTSVQVITPSHLRGRMTGVLIALVPIFSQGLGPMLIGAMTDFLFEDPKKIGVALAIVATTAISGGFILLRVVLARVGPLLPPAQPNARDNV